VLATTPSLVLVLRPTELMVMVSLTKASTPSMIVRWSVVVVVVVAMIIAVAHNETRNVGTSCSCSLHRQQFLCCNDDIRVLLFLLMPSSLVSCGIAMVGLKNRDCLYGDSTSLMLMLCCGGIDGCVDNSTTTTSFICGLHIRQRQKSGEVMLRCGGHVMDDDDDDTTPIYLEPKKMMIAY
jgi:hypothetical protein